MIGNLIRIDELWCGLEESDVLIPIIRVWEPEEQIIIGNALVTKKVPPYAVVGGNPAKIIKY